MVHPTGDWNNGVGEVTEVSVQARPIANPRRPPAIGKKRCQPTADTEQS
jgi:hypothetical protein